MSAINPNTGDIDAHHWEKTPYAHPLAQAALILLLIRQGEYWADPTRGSRLHELRRHKDLPNVQELAQQYAEQALEPLTQEGMAQKVEVFAGEPLAGWLALSIDLTDFAGQVITATHRVEVGG